MLKQKGFTLMELLIVIGIMAGLLGIGLQVWPSLSARKNVDVAALSIVTAFDTARMSSVTSKNGQLYGVNVASTSVTIFTGQSFDQNNVSNEKTDLSAGSIIATTTFTGGVSSIIFSRLTGTPSATGTLYVVSLRDPSIVKIIEIDNSGLAKSL